jgi:hypothetical protein
MIGVFKEPIVAQFVLRPQQDEYSARHPGRQSGKVDKRKDFVAGKISKCDFEIIFQHIFAPCSFLNPSIF